MSVIAARAAEATRKTFVCERCQATVYRKGRGGGKDRRRFCSRECSFAQRAHDQKLGNDRLKREREERRQRTCSVCSCSFQGHPKSNVCGRVCAAELQRHRRIAAYGVVHRQCPQCARSFKVAYNDKHRLCSEACRALRARLLNAVSPSRKAAKVKRKAVLRGAMAAETVVPIKVFARDGWRCQLCGIYTPKRIRGANQPNSPELDHIVPLASGGAHSYANTQCLCRSCNSSKGATVRGQLRLVG